MRVFNVKCAHDLLNLFRFDRYSRFSFLEKEEKSRGYIIQKKKNRNSNYKSRWLNDNKMITVKRLVRNECVCRE